MADLDFERLPREAVARAHWLHQHHSSFFYWLWLVRMAPCRVDNQAFEVFLCSTAPMREGIPGGNNENIEALVWSNAIWLLLHFPPCHQIWAYKCRFHTSLPNLQAHWAEHRADSVWYVPELSSSWPPIPFGFILQPFFFIDHSFPSGLPSYYWFVALLSVGSVIRSRWCTWWRAGLRMCRILRRATDWLRCCLWCRGISCSRKMSILDHPGTANRPSHTWRFLRQQLFGSIWQADRYRVHLCYCRRICCSRGATWSYRIPRLEIYWIFANWLWGTLVHPSLHFHHLQQHAELDLHSTDLMENGFRNLHIWAPDIDLQFWIWMDSSEIPKPTFLAHLLFPIWKRKFMMCQDTISSIPSSGRSTSISIFVQGRYSVQL